MKYRAIHIGGNNWAVRRFNGNGTCDEARVTIEVEDPQLRSSDKKAIDAAVLQGKWERVP